MMPLKNPVAFCHGFRLIRGCYAAQSGMNAEGRRARGMGFAGPLWSS